MGFDSDCRAELAKKLPLTLEDKAWKSLDSKDGLGIANALPDIAKAHLMANLHLHKQDPQASDAVDFLVHAKLLAVAEMLIRQHLPELGATLPTLCPPKLCYFFSDFEEGTVGTAFLPV